MATPRPAHLTLPELERLLATLPHDVAVTVERVRPHNRGEIRRAVTLRVADLREQLLRAHHESHLPGGDLELDFDALGQRLVAHHDGVFWLESLMVKP